MRKETFQPRKHQVKKDMAIHGKNRTIGIPVVGLTIPQLLLGGLARDILHGWRQSKGSKNVLCITALRQSFVVATRPLCLPTLRRRAVGKTVLSTCRQHLRVQQSRRS